MHNTCEREWAVEGWMKEIVIRRNCNFSLTRASCLRKVSLEVVPEVVQRGEKVILRCHYDLENAPLYSLKWYRGRHEFYRFSPTEEASTKIFNISGINVDPDNSNKSQVTLRNVDFGLSGTFICEVTADAPTFSTASASKNLTVVSLPREEPVIVSERERYDPGDMLRANCSLPPSKPPVHLSFTLNSIPAHRLALKRLSKPFVPRKCAVICVLSVCFLGNPSSYAEIEVLYGIRARMIKPYPDAPRPAAIDTLLYLSIFCFSSSDAVIYVGVSSII
ncbi:hypothetical protein P5V15_007229 [Pogonomyrmex californicus]